VVNELAASRIGLRSSLTTWKNRDSDKRIVVDD
jgi:hypothetical protein